LPRVVLARAGEPQHKTHLTMVEAIGEVWHRREAERLREIAQKTADPELREKLIAIADRHERVAKAIKRQN
jgi:hypothetical protein